MKTLIGLLLIVIAPAVMAADATITWTHPTRNVDGSSIPATGAGSIAATRMQVGTCSGTAFGTLLNEILITGQGTTATFTGLSAGSTVCFRGFSRNTYGQESAVSNIVSRVIPAPVPQPPVLSSTINVAVTIDSSYRIKLAGTIPIGTECAGKSKKAGGVVFHPVEAKHVSLYQGQTGSQFWSVCAAS